MDAALPPDDAPQTEPATPAIDAAALKDAHARTGRMFQSAGLPFDEDEFEDSPSGASDTDNTDADTGH